MIYLDNAATTFPKPLTVIKEVNKCLTEYCGNPGRSSHKLSLIASEKIYETRETIADFLSFDRPENIVFCQNATHGLNLVIKGLLNHKCHVIISDLEHNSVIRPINKAIKNYGCEVSILDTSQPIETSLNKLIKPSTELIVITMASNVTGTANKIKTISTIAKRHNIKLVMDGSQFIGHSLFSCKDFEFDYLVVPGHKGIFGIQGAGFVVFNNDSILDTLFEGGSGYDTLNTEMPSTIPERYEAGTLSTPAICSILSGIKYINSIGVPCIEDKLLFLTEKCKERILELQNVKVYGAGHGIVCFNVNGISSSTLASMLSNDNIASRSGLHCAPLIHKKMGTLNGGALRVSFSYLNSIDDVDNLYYSLKGIINKMKQCTP